MESVSALAAAAPAGDPERGGDEAATQVAAIAAQEASDLTKELKKSETLALLVLAVSALIFSIQGIFVKFANDKGVPSLQLVGIRAGFQGVVVAATIVQSGVSFIPPKGSRVFVLLRGVVGGMGFMFYFHAMSMLDLGDAITLLSLYPVLSVFSGWYFLGEPIHVTYAIAAVLCVLGAVAIGRADQILAALDATFQSDPAGGSADNHSMLAAATAAEEGATATTSAAATAAGAVAAVAAGGVAFLQTATSGYIAALTGSFTGSIVFILMRLSKGAHTLQLLMSWAVCSFLLSVVVGSQLQSYVMPADGETWGYLATYCIVGTIAHAMMNWAGRLAPAGLGAIMRSSDIAFGFLWEVVVFGVVPNVVTVLAAVVIVMSVIMVARVRSMLEARRQQAEDDGTAPPPHLTGQLKDSGCAWCSCACGRPARQKYTPVG